MEKTVENKQSTAEEQEPPIHPTAAPLAYLLGKWRGEGKGGKRLDSDSPLFEYVEELSFSHSGKPAIEYKQRTWKVGSEGEAMHGESGYFLPKPDGSIDVVIAQSSGLVEVQKGTYKFDDGDKVISLKSQLVGNSSKVNEIYREFIYFDGKLRHVVEVSTTTTNSLVPHLRSLLHKL
ncbi:unnamed protein product [Cochlearia groenlandica]